MRNYSVPKPVKLKTKPVRLPGAGRGLQAGAVRPPSNLKTNTPSISPRRMVPLSSLLTARPNFGGM